MRPLHLEVSAFGPFAGAESVDFESLGPEALFLIHGATGSGKSTLLDAMCFALYGQSLGGDRTGEQLRSDHADPAEFTQVQFDFSVGSRRYRVKRSPEQERLKKSGKGTTRVGPKATLLDADAEFAPLAEGKKKVDTAIAKVLGFACDDFRQVVMLPQGRFRELLSAGSKERQKVLARIFHTERFKDLIERLKKAHKELEAQAGQGQALVEQLLGGVDVDSVEALAQRIENGAEECTKLKSELVGVTQAVHDREAELAALEEDERVVEAHRAAVVALEQNQADAPRIAIVTKRLQLARKAEPLVNQWRSLQELQSAVNALAGSLALATSDAKAGDQALTLAQQEKARAEAGQAELPDLRKSEQEMEGLGTLLQTIKDLEDRVEARVETAENAHVLSKQKEAQAEHLAGLLGDLQARIKHRRDQAGLEIELDLLRKQVEVARKHVAHTLQLKAIEDQIALKTTQFSALSDQLVQAESEEAAGRQARLKDLAGSLAGGLKAQEACPVCGSLDHPEPAHAGESSLSQEEMNALGERVKGLKGTREAAQSALSADQQRKEGIKGQRAALEPSSVPLSELKQGLEKLESGFQSAQSERSLQALESEVDGLQTKVEQAKAGSLTAYGASMTAKQALTGEQSALKEAEGRLPEGLGSLAQVQARSAQVAGQITTIGAALEKAQTHYTQAVAQQGRTAEALKQQRSQFSQGEKRVEAAQTQVSETLEGAGFETEKAWKEARLSGAEQDGLEVQVRQAEAARIAAVDLEARTRKACEKCKAQGDLDLKKQAVAQARMVRDQALKRLALFEQTVGRFRETLDRVVDLKAKGGAIEQRYAIAGQLADVAKGKNPAKLDFERYVLGVMLDEVLQSAAFRLKAMSRGRYTLHRALSLEDGRRVAGLDLDIMDHWTGHARSVATLSGGEGFLAALALALGLADVIQSTTGGIHLEAVFIDEGFGSLDPEALEMAMRALEDLRQSGRMVGLISHVAELKERIDTRIEVKRSRNGSCVQMVRN